MKKAAFTKPSNIEFYGIRRERIPKILGKRSSAFSVISKRKISTENISVAEFTFELDEKTSGIVAKSLLPESKRIVPRTKVEIKNNKNKLVLNIIADDVSALRAAVNSYLRWIKTAVDMSNVNE